MESFIRLVVFCVVCLGWLWGGLALAYTHDPADITVEMSGYALPIPNVVTRSSNYQPESYMNCYAWSAFDHTGVNQWFSQYPPSLPEWLCFDFGAGKLWAVTRYTITGNIWDTANNPSAWKFQGSLDGSNWVDLDSRSGISWGSAGETKSFSFSNAVGYRLHRLWVTAIYHQDNVLTVGELELFGTEVSPPEPEEDPMFYFFGLAGSVMAVLIPLCCCAFMLRRFS